MTQKHLFSIGFGLGVSALILSLLVILGWVMQIPMLAQISAISGQVSLFSALCLASLSVLCLSAQRGHFKIAQGGAAIIFIAIIIWLWISQSSALLEISEEGAGQPNTMTPQDDGTDFCCSLLFLLLCLGIFSMRIKGMVITVGLLCFVLMYAVLSIILGLGAHGISNHVYGLSVFHVIPVHTNVVLVLLCSAFLVDMVARENNNIQDRWIFGVHCLAAMMGLLTLIGWQAAQEITQARNQAYFDNLASKTLHAVQERYALYEQTLWGGVALFYSSEIVTKAEWERYAMAVDEYSMLKGMYGVGYIEYVLAQDLPEFLDKTRRDGVPEFVNHPSTFYPDKMVIKYIEPVENNYQAVGLDIGFEPNRRTAAERARDLGQPAITKKIELVQDNKKQPGFLLLLPVYHNNYTPLDLLKRRQLIRGWVYAPFTGARFFKDITIHNKKELDVHVYDGTKAVEPALIYSSEIEQISPEEPNYMQSRSVLDIAGREWTLIWTSSHHFNPPVKGWITPVVGIIGGGLTIFVWFFMLTLARTRHDYKIKNETNQIELRGAESTLRALRNMSFDAIITIDQDGRMLSFNRSASDIFGYDPSEVIGKKVDILMPEPYASQHDSYLLRYYKSNVPTVIGKSRELQAKRKDGEVFPILLAVREIESEHGRRFLGIVRDLNKYEQKEEW